jgi:hypothetical protein
LSLGAVVATAGALALGGVPGSAHGASSGRRSAKDVSSCVLGSSGSRIRHVIYLQFDNTHLSRDNPRVPSDLQQMPNLLDFLTDHGVVINHEHTPLIAHTADDIVTSETGVYGARHGMPISNEYNYYRPDGSTDTAGSFAYWTDPIVDYDTSNSAPVGDPTPTMVSPTGRIAPAPWVPYTRAGCNFGSVAAANTELENTVPDVANVFGQNSPQAAEAANPKLQNEAAADFEGLSVHCAAGSPACSRAHGGVVDRLVDEPGGYRHFRALFGNKYVAGLISPNGPVRNLYGKVIKDSSGDIGFPGYNAMTAANALAYTADMQEHGVPVTYTYLSDLHESWQTGNPFGPGEAGYERQLHAENAAFGVFFHRLAADGITPANTLFVVTADEGDRFVGSAPTPSNCDGVHITCHYQRIGELDANLTALLARKGVNVPFDVAADSAPAIYAHHQPARDNAGVRHLERALARLRVADPLTGGTARLTRYLADPVELRILHLVTGDPRRTPTLISFGNTAYWQQSGAATCPGSCITEDPTEAWNHGDVAPVINTTWLGMVGPGVRHLGIDPRVWSDHTDIRPTMLTLLGLRDDYQHDGVTLTQLLQPSVLPYSLRVHQVTLGRLERVYTQLEAPVGRFGLATLRISTAALASYSSGDRRYTSLEETLSDLGSWRDWLAVKMRNMLEAAAYAHRPIDESQATRLIGEGRELLRRVVRLANHVT